METQTHTTQEKHLSLNASIAAFEEHICTKKKQAPNTALGYLQTIRRFKDHITRKTKRGLLRWDQVDLSVAQDYLAHLTAQGKSPRSINLTITSLRMFFDFLVLRGETSENPFYEIRHVKVPPSEPSTLTDEDIRKLVGAPTCLWHEVLGTDPPRGRRARDFGDYKAARDEAIIRLLFFAGLKTGEVVTLRAGHFDRDTSLLSISSDFKSRSVFLLPSAASIFVKSQDLKESLFPHQQAAFISSAGEPLSARSVERLVKQYASYYGVRADISPRDLRRAFERRLILAGAEEWLIQYLLGHEDCSTTTELVRQMRFALHALSKKIEEPEESATRS